MNIAIAQLDYIIGDFIGNTDKIIKVIIEAKNKGADLICFSELSICGYPPRDFLEFSDFIDKTQESISQILNHTDGIAVVIGSPIVNPVIEGKDLYNAALVLQDREVVFEYHKSLLPTYDIFDENRYFEPGSSFPIFHFRGYKIAITVCEDIWNISNENPLYTICPMDELIKHQPDFAINISASPFSYEHALTRKNIVQANANRYQIPFFYINQTGAQTEILFDGGSLVVNAASEIVDELPYFEEEMRIYNLDEIIKTNVSIKENQIHKTELIHKALICGIQGYFSKLNLKSAIIGLSGGIDSAVTAALAVEALGAEHVRGVLMPGPFSSDHSVHDAKQLAVNLGIQYDIVPIDDGYDCFNRILEPLFEGKLLDVTEENLQARIRGMILMAISNKFGYIVLNTSNKSEAAVGYGTLYGDMCGGLSVIGDVYKMEVYELAHFVNRHKEIIPLSSITKPPSAELRPDQKDSDSLPDYELLDQILYQYIEKFKGPKEIIGMGFDEHTVQRVLRMVNMNEFKRFQTPPVLRVSSKAFGMGRRMPIVGKYLA